MIANLVALVVLALAWWLGLAAIFGARDGVRQSAVDGDEPSLAHRVGGSIVILAIAGILLVVTVVALGFVIA